MCVCVCVCVLVGWVPLFFVRSLSTLSASVQVFYSVIVLLVHYSFRHYNSVYIGLLFDGTYTVWYFMCGDFTCYVHTSVPCRLDLAELHTQKQSHLNQHISAVKQQKEVSCITTCTYSVHLLWVSP